MQIEKQDEEPVFSAVTRLMGKLRLSTNTVLVILAVLVGVAGGLFSAVFYWLIQAVQTAADAAVAAVGGIGLVTMAGLGGLIVGPMIYFWAREAKGHGVPEVMEAIAVRGGKIRTRVPIVKSLASAVTIGTGGSAGREGPIVQIGSGLGSVLGQFFKLPERRIKVLVACGAAAGISATFNAPIAGSIFALEVVLGEFAMDTFGMVVLSAATASVVAWSFLGKAPAFIVPQYDLVSGYELIYYAVFGVIAALVAVFYFRTLYKFEDIFDKWNIVPWVKPAVGGVLFGILGLIFPQSLRAGYGVIEQAIHGDVALIMLVALVFVKILSTSLTIGSGGSGGVFAPSLFVGAMTGGVFGTWIHGLFPAITASPGAYALVGMGAVFAGSTQAPITGIIILFELTRDYRIVVPLMIACVIASLVSSWVSEGTIYTLKLRRRGIVLKSGKDMNILGGIRAADAMIPTVDTVRNDMLLGDVIEMMQNTRHTGFPVVDRSHKLVGIITLNDIRNTNLDGRLQTRVSDAMAKKVVVAYPDQTLDEILGTFELHDIGRLPVVSRQDSSRLVGLLTRSDVIKAYNRALLKMNGHGTPGSPVLKPT